MATTPSTWRRSTPPERSPKASAAPERIPPQLEAPEPRESPLTPSEQVPNTETPPEAGRGGELQGRYERILWGDWLTGDQKMRLRDIVTRYPDGISEYGRKPRVALWIRHLTRDKC